MGSHKMKIAATALLLLALISAMAGAVYAYLSASTGPLNNSFATAPNHTIDIAETFPTDTINPVKKNVSVNVGNPGYAVYVRVAIVISWRDSTGKVYGQAPVENQDYRISLNAGNGNPWFQGGDGFYYLREMFTYSNANGGKTPVLIAECAQLQAGPTDYTLHVEVIAQTIQALGSTDDDGIPAVTDAWKIQVDLDPNSANYQQLIDPNP